jgi:hypothetical protein
VCNSDKKEIDMSPELDPKLLARCGMYCGFCAIYKGKSDAQCDGCYTKEGQQFWGECKIYACCEEHGVEHCGLCDDLPCEFFAGYFPNAPDNVPGQRDTFLRAGLLAYRKRTEPEMYLEMVKKLKKYIERF